MTVTEPNVKLASVSQPVSHITGTKKGTDSHMLAAKQELPLDVKRLRLELVQASEAYEVLQDESVLTSLPDADDLPNKAGRNGNTVPGQKVISPLHNGVKLS